MSETITVRYKCECLTADASIQVPVREPGQDLGDWLRGVCGPSIHLDHCQRSPSCKAHSMEYLKVPYHGAEDFLIGGKSQVH